MLENRIFFIVYIPISSFTFFQNSDILSFSHKYSFSGDVFGLSEASFVNGTIVPETFSVPIKLEFEFMSPKFTMFD